MSAVTLPPSSWAPLRTQRLRRPQVVWTRPDAGAAGFDPDAVYCCPQAYEAPESYTDDTRDEWADRYGGTGIGTAGGSGRCSLFGGGLQTKGVGVTPLVGPDADRNHSSGAMTLVEASLEALYANLYAEVLPFGAVPVHAIVLTGGHIEGAYAFDLARRPPRALAIRPFVHRPAHFMRNLRHPAAHASAGAQAPGWVQDTLRTRAAIATLAENFRASLGVEPADELATLDRGLRELARRCAWQAAASFAKRLPHGSVSCSNLSLSGAYLDFGLSGFVPSYRRFTWNPTILDSWQELHAPVRTLMTLLGQLRSYHPLARSAGFVAEGDLMAVYSQTVESRLAVEMAKMSGFSEDMLAVCPADVLHRALGVMREVWSRGAAERCVGFSFPGVSMRGGPMPPPRVHGRYDLTAIMMAAGGAWTPDALDRALAPLLGDDALRGKYVAATTELRNAVGQHAAPGWQQHVEKEAERKNASLEFLRRNLAFDRFMEKEMSQDYAGCGPVMDELSARALHVLADEVRA